jgi:LmbE family N-acetylglucosaminyl deacetylase
MNRSMCQLDLTSYLKIRNPVVIVGFHPDDIDFHCSCLAAALTALGVEVIYVVVTSGEKNGLVKEREEEQRRSAAAVGVRRVIFLRRKDGKLKEGYFNGKLNARLENVLRDLRPLSLSRSARPI